MNKGWPSLLWNLYGSDGDQAGSYFGAQEADRPLHALYALDNGTVTLDNLSNTTQSGLTVEAKVYSTAGRLLDDQTARGITLNSQQVANKVLTPVVPKPGSSPVQDYFVELLLSQDATNWDQTLDNPAGVITTYANLNGLRTLPSSSLAVTAATTRQAGTDGAGLATTVTIKNTSSSAVAFLLRADVRRGTASGKELPGDNELQSSTWQDNDITLFPGESQTLTVTYSSADLEGATPVISVSGWNAAKIDVPAPSQHG
jgi:exo-1,4-beta-D-glucosaminidase